MSTPQWGGHNKVPKWLLLAHLQSYQSQMQYQASYRHNKTTAVVWSPAALHQKVGEQHIWQNSFKLNSFAVINYLNQKSQSSYYWVSYGPTAFKICNELFEKNWLSTILLRDNSHLLILSRWVIIYGSETSPCESSPKSRWMSYWRKIGYLQYF